MHQQQKLIYFIAIIPPKILADEITQLRKELLFGFNTYSEHKKFPHITLQHTFRKSTDIIPPLTTELENLAKTITPFSVTLDGFGHFNKRVIYISVINNASLQHLFDEVQHVLLQKFGFTDAEITKTFHPHITLEKKLTPEQFNEGWSNVHSAVYHAAFEVQEFALMKHNGVKWEAITNFQLAG